MITISIMISTYGVTHEYRKIRFLLLFPYPPVFIVYLTVTQHSNTMCKYVQVLGGALHVKKYLVPGKIVMVHLNETGTDCPSVCLSRKWR